MKKKKLALRLAQILVVLVGISFVTFLLTYLSPGDPVRNMYTAAGIMPTEELVAETREELGLNDPLPTQYLRWLRNCLRGDFGKSYTLNKPVTELLLGRLWPTVKLTLLSIGLLLMLAFCVHIKVFPVISSAGDLRSIFLPALTLALAMSSKYTRQVRTAVLEEMNQDYVVGARERGVRESVILWRNVFPNALLPLITMFGLSVGSLLGGTSVVEVIFSYPGLGNLAVSAITSSDYNLIQGYVLWLALIYMVINLLVDASYGAVDPRMRAKEQIR